MGSGSVRNVFLVLTAPLYRWRNRSARRDAVQLFDDHGAEAVRLVREQIAQSRRYEQRRHLYRVHDEIARRLGWPA